MISPAAHRLTRETGIVAGRLATLLDRLFPDAGAARDGRELLRSAATAPVFDLPAGAPALPFDRFAALVSGDETSLCVLAGMADEHEGFSAVFRGLHPRGESRPSAGLAAQLLCDGADERAALRQLLEAGRAVRSGILRVTGDAPFFERSLELAPKLWVALAGVDAWPDPMQRIENPVISAGLDEWFASGPVKRALLALADWQPCTILVTADNEYDAFDRAQALVNHAGRESAGFALPGQADPRLEQWIGIHCHVRNVAPVIRLSSPDGPGSPWTPEFTGFRGPAVLCARPGVTQIRGTRPLLAVACDRLSPRARRLMWSTVLPRLAGESAALASRHPVEPAMAAAIATDLMAMSALENRPPTAEDAAGALRARSVQVLSGGVKLITPSATWSHLVLPPERLLQLKEVGDRLRLQDRVIEEWGFLRGRSGSRGVRMLFAGPSGTGKTLAAEVLANALGVDLLCVDISRVVSKWLGETEKNLAGVFEAAERSQAVLFFDEADALFGKRTEVSDAHDRYANLETAYLLSRLERFEGLAILATNLRLNIDPAFLRRVEFSIDFDPPDREERIALWRAHVPPEAPLGADVNLAEFATLYPVVGGFIRNAAVAAGFLAAGNGGVIGRDHFIHAIRREYGKAGKAFPGIPAGTGSFSEKGTENGHAT